MKNLLRYVLALIAGVILGSIANMVLITLSGHLIPPPAGADTSSIEGLKSTIHLFEPVHYVFPFLAHAIGTLVGAFFATKIAASQQFGIAMIVGAFFLAGGITNLMMLPSPIWFSTVDLVFAYLPMAWLGGRLAIQK